MDMRSLTIGELKGIDNNQSPGQLQHSALGRKVLRDQSATQIPLKEFCNFVKIKKSQLQMRTFELLDEENLIETTTGWPEISKKNQNPK